MSFGKFMRMDKNVKDSEIKVSIEIFTNETRVIFRSSSTIYSPPQITRGYSATVKNYETRNVTSLIS